MYKVLLGIVTATAGPTTLMCGDPGRLPARSYLCQSVSCDLAGRTATMLFALERTGSVSGGSHSSAHPFRVVWLYLPVRLQNTGSMRPRPDLRCGCRWALSTGARHVPGHTCGERCCADVTGMSWAHKVQVFHGFPVRLSSIGICNCNE